MRETLRNSSGNRVRNPSRVHLVKWIDTRHGEWKDGTSMEGQSLGSGGLPAWKVETVEVPAIQHTTGVLSGNGRGETSDTEFWKENGREICQWLNRLLASGLFQLLVEYGNGNIRVDRIEVMHDDWVWLHPSEYPNSEFMFLTKWYRPMTLLLGKRVFL